MNPVIIGVTVAAIAVGAFGLGIAMQAVEDEGPAEEVGAAIDEAAGDLRRGVEDAAD